MGTENITSFGGLLKCMPHVSVHRSGSFRSD